MGDRNGSMVCSKDAANEGRGQRLNNRTTQTPAPGHGLVRRWWALCAAAVLATMVVSSPAGADDPPGFVNGDGSAFANLFDLKIQLAGDISGGNGLSLGFGAGRAIAGYQDATATAEGRVADYALTDLINMQPTAECPDYIPIYLDSTKPPQTLADSSSPGSDVSQLTVVKYAGYPTYGPVFGTQDAVAGPSTTSTATTTAKLIDSGVVKMVNPQSTAATRVVNGVREAVAVSSADSLSIMGGAMTLFRPKWTATARSGATTVADASFTYSSAIVLGISRPGGRNDDLQAFKGFVESTFSALGLKIILPKATIEPGPNGTGSVSISPFIVGMQNIPLGSSLIKPVLRALSPNINEALTAYLAQKCSNPAMELLADVAQGVLGGTGGLSFSAGGADAKTDDIYYAPPSFDLPSAEVPDTTAPTSPSFDSPVDDFSTPPTSVLSDFETNPGDTTSSLPPDTTVPTTEPDTTTTSAAARQGERREVAEGLPIGQRSKPGSKGGTAGWLTIAVLGAVLVLAGADQFVMRRSRRRFTP